MDEAGMTLSKCLENIAQEIYPTDISEFEISDWELQIKIRNII